MSGGTKGEQSGFAVMRWSWTGFVPLLLAGRLAGRTERTAPSTFHC